MSEKRDMTYKEILLKLINEAPLTGDGNYQDLEKRQDIIEAYTVFVEELLDEDACKKMLIGGLSEVMVKISKIVLMHRLMKNFGK